MEEQHNYIKCPECTEILTGHRIECSKADEVFDQFLEYQGEEIEDEQPPE